MYIERNLNPASRKVGDCTVRAIVAVTGISWEQTLLNLTEIALKVKEMPNSVEVIDIYLKQQGFIEGKVKVSKGTKRPTVREFAEQNPEKMAVLRVAHHVTCCFNGNYIDIWDCGNKSVYKYWYMVKK